MVEKEEEKEEKKEEVEKIAKESRLPPVLAPTSIDPLIQHLLGDNFPNASLSSFSRSRK